MDNSQPEEEFISMNLRVPKNLVGQVYRAVADIIDGNSIVSPPPPTSHGDVKWWTKDKLAQLKQDIHNPSVLALLNLTAERSGDWVLFDEIYETAHRSARQAQGDLAGFTQLIKKRFEYKFWPVILRPNTSSSPYSYCMPPEIAQRWKEL